MKKLKSAIVGLDFTEIDDDLISYTKFMHSLLSFEKIHFFHVIPNLLGINDTSGALREHYSIVEPIDEQVKNNLEEKVKRVFHSAPSAEVEIDVFHGSPYRKMIELIETCQADLLIVGKKRINGSGITPRRIAHHVKCNILYVPEQVEAAIERIMVPTDFSKLTGDAIRTALIIKSKLPETKITNLHLVRRLPSDYYFGLDQNSGYVDLMVDAAQSAYQKMMDDEGIPVEDCEEVHMNDDYGNVARHLEEYARQKSIDLVIMGAKSHSVIGNLFIGSTTERFVEYCRSVPVLLVRE